MKLNILTLGLSLIGLAHAIPATVANHKTTSSHKTTTATRTSTSTSSTTASTSISTSSTTTRTSTATSSTPASPSSCASISAVLLGPGEPVVYKQYFSGRGVTLDPQNPGNNYNSPITVAYGGTRCEAATHCANVGATANYYSFDLHYLNDQKQWQCVLYFEGNKDAAYFDVVDGNVGEVYGYST